MSTPSSILLLDDGELQEVAELIDELELPYTRMRGGEIPSELGPPTDLLIVTPRRAEVVRRGSPKSARNGRPVRIVAVREDSPSMRRMLRAHGFSLLVRQPTDPGVWRLLIRRALYQGSERRRDSRVPVGSTVALSDPADGRGTLLLDVSNRGCRLRSNEPFTLGKALSVELGPSITGDETLELRGRIVRIAETRDGGGAPTHSAALKFDPDLGEEARRRLGAVINKWSMGLDSVCSPQPGGALLPPSPSAEIPGLTLDDETDPSIRVEEPVSASPDVSDASDRRVHPRGAYAEPVLAQGRGGRLVLMGRDLSPGGMRIERLPDLELGDSFELALHGPTAGDPMVVRATVVRDDGENGLALAFGSVPEATAKALERLVACLPDVEALDEGEAHGLGAIISEVLDDRWRVR